MHFNSYLFSMAPTFILPSELLNQQNMILKNSMEVASEDKLTLENLKLFYINKINKLKYKYALENLSANLSYSDIELYDNFIELYNKYVCLPPLATAPSSKGAPYGREMAGETYTSPTPTARVDAARRGEVTRASASGV